MTDPDFIIADLKHRVKTLEGLLSKIVKATDEQREAGKKDTRYMVPIWEAKKEIAELLNPVKERSQSLFEAK